MPVRSVSVLAFAAALVLTGGAARAADGPYGIAMGAPVSQLPGAKGFKPGWYHVASPPEPDAQFAAYAVEAFKATGVCGVQAVSPEIGSDPEGTKVRAAIDHLVQTYSTTLGQPERLDSCTALICTPDLWAADMMTGDRHYGFRWQVRGGLKRVREVSVIAVAHSVNRFVYLVEYQSNDLTGCTTQETADR